LKNIAPGGLEIPHGFQQSVVVLVASHQGAVKPGWGIQSRHLVLNRN